MKKTSYIHLALITASFASCKTTSYQQSSCRLIDSTAGQDSAFIQDSCSSTMVSEVWYDVLQSIYNNLCYITPYGHAAFYAVRMQLYRPPRRFLKSHFIIRGGFGSSSKSVSS